MLPRARGSPHKVLGGHRDRHQHTSPQLATKQAARAALRTCYRQAPTSLPAAPLPRASFIPDSIPASAPLPETTAAASCKENCLPSSPTNPNISQCLPVTHHLSFPPDTSSASLGSASPKSTPAVPCILLLTLRVPGPTELPVVQAPFLPSQHPCAASEPCMHSLSSRFALMLPRTPSSICPDLSEGHSTCQGSTRLLP